MTALPVITADERLKETRGVKGVLLGTSGIGKTSQLWTLPPESTLFMDLEAGDLAIEGWSGDTIRPRTWAECRDFAVFIGGANPALRDDQAYSRAHFEAVCRRFGDPAVLDRYQTVFIDSITVAGRLCFQWCKGQPEAFSEKTGKPDVRATYGLHGREMIGWLSQLQHTRGKNVWFVGILDERVDDFNRRVFTPQIEGSKTGLELPGIVDEVITMAEIAGDDGTSYRAFVCQTLKEVSGEGPEWPPRPDRGAASRTADGEDPPSAHETGSSAVRVWPPGRARCRSRNPQAQRWNSRSVSMNAHSDFDFNGAEPLPAQFELIPANTLAKVHLTIRPGAAGPDGWLTQSQTSDALYLSTEAVILEGPYAKRHVYTRIGIRGKSVSEGGEDSYANRGRLLIRGLLESARGIHPDDASDRARAARTIRSFGDLNGLTFAAKIGVERDRRNGEPRNVIAAAITPDHQEYAALSGNGMAPAISPGAPATPPWADAASPEPAASPSPADANKPFWAR